MTRIPGFYRLSIEDRIKKLKELAGLTDEEVELLGGRGLSLEQADRMIENVVGTFSLPLGVAVNFLINGRDYLIPMVTEEPSVVAAASNAAKMAREGGGFRTSSTEPVMIGQIQLIVGRPDKAKEKVLSAREELIKFAEQQDPTLVRFGGGVRDLEARVVDKDVLVVHVHVNVADAMGANAVNTMCEALAPKIEGLTGGRVILRILSNYAVKRLAGAEAVFTKDSLGGEEVVDWIIRAYELAAKDVYRAVTHNKGVMNGVTSVVLSTGNDTRAIEAGCHSYAVKDGKYTSLTVWSKNKEGDLVGKIELPLALGIVGGATKSHATARIALKILNVKSARELGEVVAAVGLAQNLAAMRALATEGIQRGHMRLHARNIVLTAGATEEEAEMITKRLVESGERITVDKAKELIVEHRKSLGGK